MKHTNNFKKTLTLADGIEFVSSLGYKPVPLTDLQQLGYTDGTLYFSKDNLIASIGPNLNEEGFHILY